MKFYDLFAGIGGFRVGMEKNGHECVGSCEIDKYARQVYAKNFGHEPEQRDVRELDPKDIPDFDCLCAGFPCQAFSLAGKRRGFEDTRGTLFFEIARIAREKQPSLLFLENVKGLLSHDKGETFRVILETLDELGYWYEWQVINSKYFVPQNRERVFIIGHLRGSSSREVLPLREDSEVNAESYGETSDVKDRHTGAITANYWKGYGAGRTMIAEPKSKHVNITKHNASRVYSKDGIAPSVMAGEGTGTRIKIAEPKLKVLKNSNDDSYRIYSTDGVARSLRANSGGLGSKTGVYAEKKITMIMNANTNSNMKNRVQMRDKTWTLTGNSGDFSIWDNYRIRKLTPTECERLQGFPDGWTKGVSDTQRYKMLGNAVTTNVVEYIGGFI